MYVHFYPVRVLINFTKFNKDALLQWLAIENTFLNRV